MRHLMNRAVWWGRLLGRTDRSRCVRQALVFALLSVGLVSGCSAPVGDEAVDQKRQPGIRSPLPQHVEDEIGDNNTFLDKSRAFDTRRDAWEDEWPVVGEDPDLWDQSGASHQAIHGTVPVRKYGFQWLRSYAQNSAIALFHEDTLIENDDGSFTLQPFRESPRIEAAAEIFRAANGWDLCSEERFSDQVQNVNYAQAFCSGTLVDQNLVLTAAHCFRDEISNQIKNDREVEKLRVVFDYNVPYRGAIPTEVPRSAVFKVRERLSIHPSVIDMALFELLDLDGNPVDVGNEYTPAPIWEEDERPPGDHRIWRAAAAIGVGARLPQKISVSRSWGWFTDPAFHGVETQADIFKGNSGGGLYDVATGTLIGVLRQQSPPTLTTKCPEDLDTTLWPECLFRGPGTEDTQSLFFVPKFAGATVDSWTGCMKWAPHDYGTGEDARLFEQLMVEHWGLASAEVKIGINQQGGAVSVNAIRRAACIEPSGSDEYATTLRAGVQTVVDEAEDVMDDPDAHCGGSGQLSCPSRSVIGSRSKFASFPGFFHTFDDHDPREFLSQSRLCTKTVPEPKVTEWLDLPEIHLESGREYTYHGSTRDGPFYYATDLDNGETTPDALYRIDPSSWTIFYADTFSGGEDLGFVNPGTNFDTTLMLLESEATGDNVTLDPSNWGVLSLANDSGCNPGDSQVAFENQTQFVAVLPPGRKYMVMVSGVGGDFGEFHLHTQSMPAARNGTLLSPGDASLVLEQEGISYGVYSEDPFVAAGATDEGCDPDDEFDPQCIYDTHPQLQCQGGNAGDVAFVALSCPEFDTEQFRYLLQGQSSLGEGYFDDPVSAYWEGHAKHGHNGYVCSDDSTTRFSALPWIPILVHSLNSEISHVELAGDTAAETYMTSGAAARGFFASQWTSGLMWENLAYVLQLPDGAVH